MGDMTCKGSGSSCSPGSYEYRLGNLVNCRKILCGALIHGVRRGLWRSQTIAYQ